MVYRNELPHYEDFSILMPPPPHTHTHTGKDGADLSITMNAEPPPDYKNAEKFPVSNSIVVYRICE